MCRKLILRPNLGRNQTFVHSSNPKTNKSTCVTFLVRVLQCFRTFEREQCEPRVIGYMEIWEYNRGAGADLKTLRRWKQKHLSREEYQRYLWPGYIIPPCRTKSITSPYLEGGGGWIFFKKGRSTLKRRCPTLCACEVDGIESFFFYMKDNIEYIFWMTIMIFRYICISILIWKKLNFLTISVWWFFYWIQINMFLGVLKLETTAFELCAY